MTEGAIDIHAHAFPDKLAERAISALEAESPCKAVLDGRLASLLASMDRAGIETSVIANIATRPSQAESIRNWCVEISSKRIIPFASVHPEDSDAPANVRRAAEAGIRGIKLHPYYQDYVLDEPRMDPIYGAIAENRLLLLSHCGYDIAFPREPKAGPDRITNVLRRFPDLRMITSHFGSWEDWDRVETLMIGRSIPIEISFSLGMIPREQAARFFRNHPVDQLFFGTDSPWADQSKTLEWLRSFDLEEPTLAAITRENARRLLGMNG